MQAKTFIGAISMTILILLAGIAKADGLAGIIGAL